MPIALVSLLLFTCAVTVAACESEPPLAEMAALHRGEMSPAIPIIRVENLRKAQRYYRDVLGFKLAWEDGDPVDFAAVKRGDAVYFMCEGCQGRGAAWSSVFVKDVDKLHEELRAKKATIRMPPKDMPWKLREMHVEDEDGNVIRFGSPIKH